MADDYKQVPYHATPLPPCGFCGSAAHMWQHTSNRDVTFVVMCSQTEDGSPTGDPCPLLMPPNTFYAATKREAAKYWGEWAKFSSARKATPADVLADAERWRSIIGCARITAMGSAGLETPNPNGYAHLTVNLWTLHPAPSEAFAVEWLRNFADIAVRVKALQTTEANR